MITILFDTETTGLLLPSTAPIDKQPSIIELGALKVDQHGAIVGQLEQLLRPPTGVLVSKEITKINGIKPEDLVDKPTFKEFLPKLIAFFTGANLLVCHNATFDTGMLLNELVRANCTDFPWPKQTVCTVQEYFPLFGYRPSLKVLHKKIMGVELVQEHRALADIEGLLAVLCKDKFFEKVSA